MRYVDVVVDNRNDSTDTFYTYGCEIEGVKPGSKVYVPFNRGNKIKDAYVFAVRDSLDREIGNLKYVDSVDEDICLTAETVDTVSWMRRRYFCRYIDAVRLFLPAGSKAKRRVTRDSIDDFEGELQDIKELTGEQKTALGEIESSIKSGEGGIFLLQGVTGSGKTEIYMRAAARCVKEGKTVIAAVPEVSQVGQLGDRFIARFGRKNIAVMHSRLTPGERYDQWQKIKNGDIKIVIGARSAVFAPIENIGLIIMDEEHEASYKSDMNPRYDTAEVAIKRASYYSGCVIMGSATPSVASLKKCEDGCYRKLTLNNRYNGIKLPEVFIEDMRKELLEGNRSVFSRRLYDEIKSTLDRKGQIMLLINRRGHSTFVSCRNCGYVVKCPRCGISMTYHKNKEKLVCHYCGRSADIPDICPECGSGYIRFFGAGTEKIEAEAKKLFPEAAVDRLDIDTASKKRELNRILKDFTSGRTDILVGTQLIGKGIDNRNVELAGILAIDTMLNIPDYRSSERTFQLITQAAGRTGRGEKRGKVVVQTYEPENFAVICGAAQDPDAFYKKEIRIREFMDYPPFGVFGQFSITGNSTDDVQAVADMCSKGIENKLGGDTIVGIRKYAKGNSDFRIMILIKFPKEKYGLFAEMAEQFKEYTRNNRTGAALVIDTDPYTLWRN